jgi:hypothetical protein
MSQDLGHLELRRERAIMHLDLYERVLVSLSAKVAHLRERLEAAGHLAEWDTLGIEDFERREAILKRMRRRGQWP